MMRGWEGDIRIKSDINMMYIKMLFIIDMYNNVMYIYIHENIKKETDSDIY